MGLVAKMALYWKCDACGEEWFADSETGPRQCKKCGSRGWNDGMVREADLYQRALVIRHLNPYRKALTLRQKAALTRLAASRRAATTSQSVQTLQ